MEYMVKNYCIAALLLVAGFAAAAQAENFPVVTVFPRGEFYVQNVNSGMVMTIESGNVCLRPATGAANQKFTAPLGGQGNQRGTALVARSNGDLTLNISGNQQRTQLAAARVGVNLSFLAKDATTFFVKTPGGLVLDAEGGADNSNRSGTRVIQWNWHGGANQQWRIVMVSNRAVFNYLDAQRQAQQVAAEQSRANQMQQQLANVSLVSILANDIMLERYMSYASHSKLNQDCKKDSLQDAIDRLDEAKRFTVVHNMIKSAVTNPDERFRFAIYKKLNKVNLNASGFIINALKGQFRNNLEGFLAKETVPRGQEELRKIISKF
jgi:hypothetical protein